MYTIEPKGLSEKDKFEQLSQDIEEQGLTEKYKQKQQMIYDYAIQEYKEKLKNG